MISFFLGALWFHCEWADPVLTHFVANTFRFALCEQIRLVENRYVLNEANFRFLIPFSFSNCDENSIGLTLNPAGLTLNPTGLTFNLAGFNPRFNWITQILAGFNPKSDRINPKSDRINRKSNRINPKSDRINPKSGGIYG